MFVYRTRLRLRDTDATGVLYFSEQFNFAMETFEEFLKEKGFSLQAMTASPYLLPVVHAEADYFAPLMVGDELEISLVVEHIGTTSIILQYVLRDPKREIEVGRAKIIHVVVDRESRASVPVPDFLRALLQNTPS